MTNIVVVDDHPLVRQGLCTVLSSADDLSVLAQGACGADALRLIGRHRPDVLILDVNLPDQSGIDVVRRLRATHDATPILILTVHDDRQTVFGLLDAGANGYVLKDDALETIIPAVRAVARGEIWLSPGIASQVVHRANRDRMPAADSRPPAGAAPLSLTEREEQVLKLLARGLDNAAIARELVLATRTVQNHVSAIYDKLGVNSRTEAMLCAIRHGLVDVSAEDRSDEPTHPH